MGEKCHLPELTAINTLPDLFPMQVSVFFKRHSLLSILLLTAFFHLTILCNYVSITIDSLFLKWLHRAWLMGAH